MSSSSTNSNPNRRHAAQSRNVSAQSAALRSYLTETEKKLFPRNGNIANCNIDDLKRQAAIFLVNRKAFRHASSPRLDSSTVYHTVDSFVKHLPFAHGHTDAEQKMRIYSMILAEALRALGQEADTLTHLERNTWYDGIAKLGEMTQTLLKDSCSEMYKIETWDAIFHLKHSENLLACIDDIQSGGAALLGRSVLLMKGALQGFNHQWELVGTIKELLKGHRNKSEWHAEYLALETLAFLTADLNPPYSSPNTYDAAYETVKQIKDYLEDELPLAKTTIAARFSTAIGRLSSQISQLTMSVGPSEVHTDYFTYGLLNLLYQLAFQVDDKRCFGEMIGSVRVVLRTKKYIHRCLYRKAVDLYYAVDELGQEKKPKRSYGEVEDLNYIKKWIHDHSDLAENAQTSRAYSLVNLDFLTFQAISSNS